MFFGQDESSVVSFDEEHQLITLCCVHMVARLFFSAHSFVLLLYIQGVFSGDFQSGSCTVEEAKHFGEKNVDRHCSIHPSPLLEFIHWPPV